MKHFLFLLLLAAPAQADISIKHTASTSLKVDGAAVQAIRVPSTYAVSGNNMKVTTGEHFGKLTAGTATAAATLDVGAYDVNTAGAAFSFSESWTQGDATNPVGSGVDVTSGVVADMPAYGEVLTMSGGVAGDLAGTITSAGVVTLTAGGANTSAVGSVVTSLTVK